MSYNNYLEKKIVMLENELDIHDKADILLDIRDNANEIKNRHDLRLGQSMMIALRRKNKELYDVISGTSADPFYDDKKIPAFEKALVGENMSSEKIWNKLTAKQKKSIAKEFLDIVKFDGPNPETWSDPSWDEANFILNKYGLPPFTIPKDLLNQNEAWNSRRT